MGLKDEQGMMAIGVALMLIVVLALFGGVLWQYSMADMRRVERAEHDMQALFLARAGAEAVLGAWLESTTSAKPQGDMDRFYCVYDENRETYVFQSAEPPNPFGWVDVSVSISGNDTQRDGLIEIVADAVVNGVSRKAKLTSYPLTFGHDRLLGWYNEKNGQIINNADVDGVSRHFVIVRSNDAIHFAGLNPPISKRFSAPLIRFETPIDFASGQVGVKSLAEWDAPTLECELQIYAEVVHFSDIILAHVPESKLGKFGLGQRDFTVALYLPIYSTNDRVPGILGREIGVPESEIESAERYGIVHFEGMRVESEELRWKLPWFSLPIIDAWRPRQATAIKTVVDGTLQNIGGGSFYFKNETDLTNLGDYDLIPISGDEEETIDLKEIRAFYWE